MNKLFACMVALCLSLSCLAAACTAAEVSTVHSLDGAMESMPAVSQSTTKQLKQTGASAAYLLGSGDKIKIHVFGQSDMDVEVRLGASGDMRFPFLGKIHITGMTLPALERKITEDLAAGYLVDPQVRISMEEFRPFYVNGEVKKPGAYPYQPGLTARKAVSLAGGLTADADKNKIFLIHSANPDDEEESVLLSARMMPGDILTIKKSFFFVNGEVKNPGKYSYQTAMTYRMAIAMAGGLKDKSNDDKVYVVHEGKDHQSVHVDNLDDEIQPGDVITTEEGFF